MPDNERRTLWINSLVEAEVARQNYAQDRALAREFAICGHSDIAGNVDGGCGGHRDGEEIQLGRAWGFNAADSIRYIYFDQREACCGERDRRGPKLQQGGYDWDVEWLEETVDHKVQAVEEVRRLHAVAQAA